MMLYQLTAYQLHQWLVKREISAQELLQAVLQRIDEVEGHVNAYAVVSRSSAMDEARRVDERLRRGELTHPLAGIPFAVKDNICTNGLRTTCASKMLHNFVPPFDATAVSKLREKGAIILGKTNLDEFGMGSSTEASIFGPTHNPWDLSRVAGGTSGGSAAAVAADESIVALGTDTGGSIRQPASFCGVVGLRPTYGRVSRYGLIAYASSLDTIGPITKDVADAAIVLGAIAEHDPRDSTSIVTPVPDYLGLLEQEVAGMTVGIPQEYMGAGVDPEVEGCVRKAAEVLSTLGVEIIVVSLPHTKYAIPTYYLIAMSEASANLARYDGTKYGYRAASASDAVEMAARTRGEGFGAEVKRRIVIGTYALSAGYYDQYYLKAQKVRTLIRQEFERAFALCDALLSPVSPFPAFAIGEKSNDPLAMYLADVHTVMASLAGIPAISVPGGFTVAGLPVGLQLQGKPLGEDTLLRLAYRLEQSLGVVGRKPPVPMARG